MRRNRIEWRTHLIDLLVVIIGVLCAFWLSSRYEKHKEQRLARYYLQGIYNDLSTDKAELDSVLAFDRRMLKDTERLLQILQENSSENDSLIIYLMGMNRLHKFVPASTTYQTLTAAGKLDLIEDLELRQHLVGYYQFYQGIRLAEEVFNRYVWEYVVPFVIEHTDFNQLRIVRRQPFSTVRFRNIVVGYHRLLQQNLDLYTQAAGLCRDAMNRLHKRLPQ